MDETPDKKSSGNKGSSGSHNGSTGHSHSHSHHHSSGSHSRSHSSGSDESPEKGIKNKLSKKNTGISLYKRVKHKIKYFYWKYKRRFKKANTVKKIGYIVIFLTIITACAVLLKLTLLSTQTPDSTTGNTNFTVQTTIIPTTEKPAVKPPEVVTYYSINDTYKVDEIFTAGFIVDLPNIVSDKPLALKINAEMAKLKDFVKQKYTAAGSIKAFREEYKYSYETYLKDNILFISVFTAHGTRSSNDFITSNKYYAYDFAADKIVSDAVILKMYTMDLTEVLDTVNSALLAVGAAQIDNAENIRYFVKGNGKLFAEVTVHALMGGTYSELVQLT
jgi:hypothetical protein